MHNKSFIPKLVLAAIILLVALLLYGCGKPLRYVAVPTKITIYHNGHRLKLQETGRRVPLKDTVIEAVMIRRETY